MSSTPEIIRSPDTEDETTIRNKERPEIGRKKRTSMNRTNGIKEQAERTNQGLSMMVCLFEK